MEKHGSNQGHHSPPRHGCSPVTLDDLLTLQLRIIQAVGESEHRIKELVLKVAGESDKAKIEKLVQELAEHRAKLTEAVKQQTES